MPSLLKQLEDLGDAIVSAEIPADSRKVLGALIYYVETGSLEPPAPPPSREEAQQISEADAEIARLRDQIATMQAEGVAAAPAAPAEIPAEDPAAAPAAPPAVAPAFPPAPPAPESPPAPPAVSA